MRRVPRMMLPLAVAAAVSVGGCGINKATESPLAEEATAEAAQKLSESATRAAMAQEELARIQTARTAPAPRPVDETMAGVPEDLRRPVTVEWSGPGEEAARRVAGLVGYSFKVVGNPPPTLPMISVSARDQAAVKVFENVGIQSQPFAQVVVDANLHRVEYRYLQSARSASAPAPRMSK